MQDPCAKKEESFTSGIVVFLNAMASPGPQEQLGRPDKPTPRLTKVRDSKRVILTSVHLSSGGSVH
eukprot:12419468-Karenia_brevis.AAC.1